MAEAYLKLATTASYTFFNSMKASVANLSWITAATTFSTTSNKQIPFQSSQLVRSPFLRNGNQHYILLVIREITLLPNIMHRLLKNTQAAFMNRLITRNFRRLLLQNLF